MKKIKCGCPAYCRFCGAKLSRDYVGHFCPTRNCQWQYGIKGCSESERNAVKTTDRAEG